MCLGFRALADDFTFVTHSNGGGWDISLFAPDGMSWDGVESEFVCTSWLIAHSRIRRAINTLGGPKPIVRVEG